MLVIKSPDHREIPAISKVRPAEKLCIEVTWGRGPRAPKTEKVDLSPLINSLKIYKPLRKNRALFETVHLLDEGGDIIVWGDNDAIDMDSLAIEALARDMMTAEDFKEFLNTLQFTHNTAGAMLGYTRRHIEYFLSGKPIPRVCSLACITLRERHRQSERKKAVSRIRLSARGTHEQATMLPTSTNSVWPHTRDVQSLSLVIDNAWLASRTAYPVTEPESLEGDTGSIQVIDQPTPPKKRISAATIYVQ